MAINLSVFAFTIMVVNLPSGSEQPRETAVQNEAVRVTDPASWVSSGGMDHTSGSNDSNGNRPKMSADTAGVHVTQRKQLKLEKYDGMSVPLETFLAKYYNCCKYNRWSEEELVHFCVIV